MTNDARPPQPFTYHLSLFTVPLLTPGFWLLDFGSCFLGICDFGRIPDTSSPDELSEPRSIRRSYAWRAVPRVRRTDANSGAMYTADPGKERSHRIGPHEHR